MLSISIKDHACRTNPLRSGPHPCDNGCVALAWPFRKEPRVPIIAKIFLLQSSAIAVLATLDLAGAYAWRNFDIAVGCLIFDGILLMSKSVMGANALACIPLTFQRIFAPFSSTMIGVAAAVIFALLWHPGTAGSMLKGLIGVHLPLGIAYIVKLRRREI